jgi:very-short-patch-repair endonuclease
MESDHVQSDRNRDEYLSSLGLKVLRFNSSEVLQERDAVVEVIVQTIKKQLSK